MKILGLSSNYHDASAALVIDGKVVAAAAEERFTLQKHDPSFPRFASRFCLEEAGIQAGSLDYIAYHEDPSSKFSRTLASSMVRFPFSLPTFLKSMREAITGGFWMKNTISKELDIDPRKVVYVPHHCSHAAHAFLTSPFAESAVLTVDAAGEWMCSGLFRASRAPGVIEPLEVMPFPHSIGLVYSAFTGYLGFKVNDGECSTMALASFGRPVYAEKVRKIIQPHADGTYSVDSSYFDFSKDDSLPLTEKFLREFGPPRPYRISLPFDCLSDDPAPADAEFQRFADIAASVQLVTEETVLRMAAEIKRRTGSPNLCISGGVALNCVAVGKVIESGLFENVFVPPDPGDGGGALGAALYLSMELSGKGAECPSYHPYHGKAFEESEVLAVLPHLKHKSQVKVRVANDFAPIPALVAEALSRGKIAGWFQGRFEVGPRALGNRSILAHPGHVETARRLSRSVKKRAAFRPYACSVAEEELAKFFPSSAAALPARWMQAAFPVRKEAVSSLRAALHTDGSTRPHICSREQNPRLHQLLHEVREKTGSAALLNTSFNERGMPMVSSPLDALMMFLRTDMDLLVINDTLLEKET